MTIDHTMIRVCDVTHHYGVRPVLRGVSLEIKRGEVVAVMGPNGMGKTTLLSLLAGIMLPSKGHIEINGMRRRADVESERSIRRQVVYLPAESWLPLMRTGRDYLLAIGKLYGVGEDRLMDHVERLFSLFHIEKQSDMPTAGYSTGQKRKLALAGALVSEAKVMILDEPFGGGLDPSGILALKKVMQSLAARDDITIVFATPVPELVESVADRVAVLGDGKLLAIDTIQALHRSTGCEGTLHEVLERMLNPEDENRIGHYLEGCAR